jgi:hypothetical protein
MTAGDRWGSLQLNHRETLELRGKDQAGKPPASHVGARALLVTACGQLNNGTTNSHLDKGLCHSDRNCLSSM